MFMKFEFDHWFIKILYAFSSCWFKTLFFKLNSFVGILISELKLDYEIHKSDFIFEICEKLKKINTFDFQIKTSPEKSPNQIKFKKIYD